MYTYKLLHTHKYIHTNTRYTVKSEIYYVFDSSSNTVMYICIHIDRLSHYRPFIHYFDLSSLNNTHQKGPTQTSELKLHGHNTIELGSTQHYNIITFKILTVVDMESYQI